ncbi:MAG TPA: hypothetical protein VFW84_12790 [Aquabacterium sp.]|uniref:hypothetical protein n=1 Tax=Aquabacterium sp. TaxID=1872578 RepID=UPI002E37BCB3|nr:hypothetical protein [Aquabacterium sp.]HEX5373601.1 hypothetical protein [Aquabacterium sp.]
MKLRIVALAAVATLAGQAQALTLAQIASARSAGTLLEVHFSGASALSAVVGGLFSQNCKAGTRNDYKSDFTDAAFAGDTANGQSVNAYTCELIAGNDFGAAFDNKQVVFQKSDQGGSGNGVFPVAYNQQLPFLNLTAANCVADVCKSNGYTRAPEGGVSDVAPVGFNPSLNRPKSPVDFSNDILYPAVSNANFQRVDGVIQTVFGLAVSKPLYDALQADQGLASSVRPSVPRAVIATMLSNAFDPSISWKALLPNSPAVNEQQVNICRRVNGSGTQTSANRFWAEYAFNQSSLIPADNANNSEFSPANLISDVNNNSVIHVYEGSSTSNVRSCLAEANKAGKLSFAIGHVSLENAETADWKFAKIDGVEPSRDNAKKGFYDYVFESTMQISNSAANGAFPNNKRAFLNGFIDAAKKPANFNQLSAAAQNGVMALPTAASCAAAPFGGYVAASAEEKFCSRVSRPTPNDPLVIFR